MDIYERRLLVHALRHHDDIDHSEILRISHFKVANLEVDYEGLADLIESDPFIITRVLEPYLAEVREKVTEQLRLRLTPYQHRPRDEGRTELQAAVETAYINNGIQGLVSSLRQHLGHAEISINENGRDTTVLDAYADHLLGRHASICYGRQIEWSYLQAAANALGVKDPNPAPRDRY